MKKAMKEMISDATKRKLAILELRRKGLTYVKIAEIYVISTERIRQLHCNAVRRCFLEEPAYVHMLPLTKKECLVMSITRLMER